MKWRLVILVLLGSVVVAFAQDMSNGLNNKGGGQVAGEKLAVTIHPSSVIAGGGGGGGGTTCSISLLLDYSQSCSLIGQAWGQLHDEADDYWPLAFYLVAVRQRWRRLCANTALLVKDATRWTPLTDPVPYIDTGDGSGQCVPKVFVFNASPNGAHNTANSPTVNVATDQSGNAYFTIAASVTAQVLGATGATGDYLGFCTIYPTSTSPGVLTALDSTSSATNNAIAFAGGVQRVLPDFNASSTFR